MNYIIPEKIDSEKDIELAIYYAQAMSDFSDEMLCKLKQLVTNKDLENRLEDKFFSTFDKIYKRQKIAQLRLRLSKMGAKTNTNNISPILKAFISERHGINTKVDVRDIFNELKANNELNEYNSHIILKNIQSKKLKHYYRKLKNGTLPDNSSEKKAQPKKLDKIKEQTVSNKLSNFFFLNWENVLFKNGYYIINPSSQQKKQFIPLTVKSPQSLECYNYMIKYIERKLPKIRCQINGNTLTVIDTVNLDNAFLMIVEYTKQQDYLKQNVIDKSKKINKISFKTCLEKSKYLTDNEIKKYKSKYLNTLISLQNKNYKIIPIIETLTYKNMVYIEDAFIFTICVKQNPIIRIIIENINPNRATIVFNIIRNNYFENVKKVFAFLNSDVINKRQELHNKSVDLSDIGTYYIVNHNDDSIHKWTFKLIKGML